MKPDENCFFPKNEFHSGFGQKSEALLKRKKLIYVGNEGGGVLAGVTVVDGFVVVVIVVFVVVVPDADVVSV